VKELSINELNKISDNWIKGKKLYTDTYHQQLRRWASKEIFKVDINIIINNLFYYDKIKSNINEHYLTTYNSLKKDGWDKELPAIIDIGVGGEIYIIDGNHRISMINNNKNKIKLYRLLHCKFPINNNKEIYCRLGYFKTRFETNAQSKIRPNWTNERLPKWKRNE